MNNRLYTIQEVANILKVSTKTLRRWDQRGRFVPIRTAGNQRRYTQEQIQEFKNSFSGVSGKQAEFKRVSQSEPFFKPEAPKELKITQGLPSIFRNLPSNSFLKHHFLLRSKDKLIESNELTGSGVNFLEEIESPAKKGSAFQIGFIFTALVLMLSLIGAVAIARYDLVGSLSQKKEQFAKFISDLPQISLQIKNKDLNGNLSFTPQEDQAVLAAATGTSDIILNVNVPSFFGQSVGIGTTTTDSSAVLDLSSEDKGFLAPRMTTVQRDAITSPAAGLFVYNTDTNQYNMYDGTSWKSVGGITAIGDVTEGAAFTETGTEGNSLYFHGTGGGVGQVTAGALSGTQVYTLPGTTGTFITTGNLTDITKVGTIGSGTWNGTTVGVANGGTGATTLTGILLGNKGNPITGITASLGIAGAISDEVGTGSLVFSTDPVFAGNVTPAVTLTSDLGSPTLVWNNVYANNFVGGSTGTAGYWQRRGNAISPTNITDSLNLGSTATSSALAHFAGTTDENSWFNTGNVGIGTTAPTQPLEVASTTNGQGIQILRSSTTTNDYAVLGFRTSATESVNNTAEIRTIRLNSPSTGDTAIAFFNTKSASLSESMRIDSSGNVGIGTTNPTSTFSVGANSEFQVNATGNIVKINNVTTSFPSLQGAANSILTNDGTGTLTWNNPMGGSGISGFWQRTLGSLAPTNITDSLNLGSTATSSALVHFTGTTDENSWFNTGNVGIGTTAPTALLDVNGTASVSAITIRGGSQGYINQVNGNPLIFQTSSGGDAGLTERMTILNNGNVGIGNTVPSALFSVGSTSQFQVNSSGAVTAVGVNSGAGLLQGTGGLTVSGNTNLSGTAGNTTTIGNAIGTLALTSNGLNVTTSGAVSGVTTLGLSGAISGAIDTNTINGLIINSGALSGISTINMSGQLTSTLSTGNAPFAVSSTTLNTNLNADLLDGQHGSYYAPLANVNGAANYIAKFTGANAVGNSLVYDNGTGVGIGTTNPTSTFSVGANSEFQVNATGNIVKINNVTTSFPSSQGAVGSILTNSDGAGTLMWNSPSGTGTLGYWQRNGTNLVPSNIGDLVGIGTTAPNARLAIVDNVTSGIILGTSYDQIVTLNGALTAAKFDLNDGHVIPTNQSVTGVRVVLPTTMNTNLVGTTVTMDGMSLGYGNGTGIEQNGTGETIYSGANLLMPALTQTSGTLVANGALITTSSSISIGGTANGVNIAAHGVGAGSLNGVNISNITGSDGTETALNIGSGWDNVFSVNGNSVVNGLGVVQVAAGGTGFTSYTSGDLIYASGTTALAKLAGGTGNNGKVLVISGGVPTWGVMSGSACTDCVINDPTSSTTQTIGPTGNNTTGLIVKQTSTALGGNTPDILSVTSADGLTKYFSVDFQGNVSTGSISNTTLTLTPTADTTALTLVGTNVPTASLEYINSKNTQGTIFNLAYGAAATLVGSLTGEKIDLATNVAASNQSVTGINVVLPIPTNTTSTSTYRGLSVALPTGAGISQNGAGSTVFSGVDVTIPALTQTSGSLTGNGVLVTTPDTITTGGTVNGIDIAARGVGSGGILRGINISGITAGAGAETAMHIGTGWDYAAIFEGGNVGIGTTNPNQKLEVNGSGYFVSGIYVGTNNSNYLLDDGANGSGSSVLYIGNRAISTVGSGGNIYGASNYISKFTADNVLGNSLMYDNGTNIGIGNTTPLTALDITGSASLSANLSLKGASTAHALNILDNGTLNFQRSPGGDAGLAANSVLFLGNNGNVGIGTTAPLHKLSIGNEVAGYTRLLSLNYPGATSDGAGIEWTTTSGADAAVSSIISQRDASGQYSLRFKNWDGAANTEHLTILANGYVGIGTTAPGSLLTVASTNPVVDLSISSGWGGTSTINLRGTFPSSDPTNYVVANVSAGMGTYAAGWGGAYLNFQTRNASGVLTDAMRITNNGSVGIGTTSPSGRLDVGNQAPGVNIPLHYIMGSGAGTGWPVDLSGIYDSSYVDQYLVLNGTLTGGTRSAPTFSSAQSNYGSYIRQTVANGGSISALELGSFPTGSAQSPTARLTINNANGNVGIGTTAPGATLTANGNVDLGDGQDVGTANASRATSITNIYSPTAMTGSTVGTESLLRFARSGTAGVKWNASADFLLGTYTAGLASNTQLDIKLGNGNTNTPDTNVMSLLGNGNVGIGTTNPAAKLTVRGSTSSSYESAVFGTSDWTTTVGSGLAIRNGAATGNTYSELVALSSGWGAWNNLVLQSGGGNVGIGIAAPTAKLHVDALNSWGGMADGAKFSAGNSDTLVIYSPADNVKAIQTYIDGNTASFGTVALNPLGGYVGVGTTHPDAKMTVAAGTTGVNIVTTDYSNPGTGTELFLGTGANTGNTYGAISALTLGGGTVWGNLVLQNGGGKVGIGTTNPGYPLTVVGNIATSTNILLGGAGGDGYGIAFGSNSTASITGNSTSNIIQVATGSTARMTFGATGNVGIGVTNPTYQLDLSTDDARKLTTTTWATGSDARIKTQVQSISDALDIIRSVRPVKFHYTPDFLSAHPSVVDTDYYNFIAQEYQQVFPNSVTESDGLLYLNSSNMIPYAIAGIKALDAEVSSNSAILANVSMTVSGDLSVVNDLSSQVASQGEALQTLQASSSASVNYILSNDSLFQTAQNKISDLESKVDLLSLQVEQQASISAFLAGIQGGQVLGASTSASLNVTLGDVELNSATISGSLMVLGRTTVTDLGVTGNINAGLLAIHGLDREIDTLSGNLYLQKNRLGGVDILNGKVVIDPQGNMTVAGTVTADNIEANNYSVLGGQSIGSSTIPLNGTSIEISTPVASISSKIFLTATSLTSQQLTVIKKSDGKFKVAIPTPATTPISFDWWIVGNR